MYDEKYELNWSKIKNALVRFKKTGIVADLFVTSVGVDLLKQMVVFV